MLSIGSKLLGFIREMLIAAKFGSGFESDSYFIALTAASLFTPLFALTLNTTMIPILSEIEETEGKLGKEKHVNNTLNIYLMISLVFVLIGVVFSPQIVRVLASGFKADQLELTVKLMRISMFVIIFSALVGVFRGYLQSESKFIESSLSDYPFNLSYILFLLFLSPIFGIQGLMITSVVAVFTQLLIQLPGIFKLGFKYKFRVDFRDPYLKKMNYLVIPVLVSVAINDVNKIVDRSLASTLIRGSISSLNYAARLNSLVLSVFIVAIATVLFPILSKEATKETYEDFKNILVRGINVILIITIPTTIGIILLADPIVKITFERGAFDSLASQMTSEALIFYTLGLTGMALRTFLERVYYSLQDTKTPMINGFFAVVLNVILNLLLIGPFAHRGLALATSIATTITSGYLFYALKNKIGSVNIPIILKCGFKSLFSSLIMGVTVYFVFYILNENFSGNSFVELIFLLTSIIVGAIIYLVTLYSLKVEEMTWFFNLFRRKLSGK